MITTTAEKNLERPREIREIILNENFWTIATQKKEGVFHRVYYIWPGAGDRAFSTAPVSNSDLQELRTRSGARQMVWESLPYPYQQRIVKHLGH